MGLILQLEFSSLIIHFPKGKTDILLIPCQEEWTSHGALAPLYHDTFQAWIDIPQHLCTSH